VAPARWETGVSFSPETCEQVWVTAVGCDPVTQPTPANNDPVVNVDSFQITTLFECRSTGHEVVGYQRRAMDAIDALTPRAVEGQFWTGAQGASDLALRKTPATAFDGCKGVIGAAAVAPARALGALIQAISDCSSGGRGAIHARPEVVSLWTDTGSVVEKGGQLVTLVGQHHVVPGVGYPGTGPNGHASAATTNWAYATSGTPQMILGPASSNPGTFNEAFDRRINMVRFQGQREAAVWWDGCLSAAIRVDLPAI